MSKIKLQIKNRFTGSLIFEYESENNTIKDTLHEAIKSGADLSGADLSRADLSRTDLSGANLYGANLSRTDLYGADLSGADLSRADLSRTDLSGANLYGANLSRTDLYGADLSRTNLYGANLYGADLSCANLSCANLYGADLSGADLYGANLSRTDLYGADLSRTNLYGANLYGADLSGADLSCANLSGANLSGANLSRVANSELIIAQTRILAEGDIVGYKKTVQGIVKLLIPAEAKRSHAFGRKCRAEFAIVIGMPDGVDVACSEYDNSFEYRLGETVRPEEQFSENWQSECESGIHFYITRIEAENH